MSRKLAQAWTDAEEVLPLLDGLDEVVLEHRTACIEAINTFRRQRGLVRLAVYSRVAEYEALSVRLELSGAVVIKPLSQMQVSTYLEQAGRSLAGVRTVLRDDQTLWELLETPLMLRIVALAYQARSAAEVRPTDSFEQRRNLLENYIIETLFERRTKVTAYTREQTLHWLTWLARSMMQHNLSVFHVERVQPDWLSSRAQRRIVDIVPIMFFGLVFGLVFGLISGLIGGIIGGLIGGLNNGGFIYVKHYILRILLWRNNYAPWNYIRFLDYAAERAFLPKVGGGYTFTHRVLMEYFATLQSTDQARQTQPRSSCAAFGSFPWRLRTNDKKKQTIA